MAVVRLPDNKGPSGGEKPLPELKNLNNLVISVLADASGGIATKAVNENSVKDMQELETRLAAALMDMDKPDNPFGEVFIQASTDLRSDKLIQIVDVCMRQRLPNGRKVQHFSRRFLERSNRSRRNAI